jgi:hypothetical protein
MKKSSPEWYIYLSKNDRSAKSNTIVAEFSISHVSLFGFCANANTGNGCATEAGGRKSGVETPKQEVHVLRIRRQDQAVRCDFELIDRQNRGKISHVPLTCTNPATRDRSDGHVVVPGSWQRGMRRLKQRLAKASMKPSMEFLQMSVIQVHAFLSPLCFVGETCQLFRQQG